MISDDLVFKALADSSRRFLLDLLHKRDGQTLSELEWELEMTRFGVMKHLKVLEEAGLVVTRREGREKLHFLNAVPIRLIHDRWIDKYKERELGEVLLPVLTPFATQHADPAVRLGRLTLWEESDGQVHPVGQKLLLADDEEWPILELRNVEIAIAQTAS